MLLTQLLCCARCVQIHSDTHTHTQSRRYITNPPFQIGVNHLLISNYTCYTCSGYNYIPVLCVLSGVLILCFLSIRVQFCRNLVLSKSDNVDWKLMYFTLQKHYPMKEQYGDTLHFCKHCSILFWKVNKHTCKHIHVVWETPYSE